MYVFFYKFELSNKIIFKFYNNEELLCKISLLNSEQCDACILILVILQ